MSCSIDEFRPRRVAMSIRPLRRIFSRLLLPALALTQALVLRAVQTEAPVKAGKDGALIYAVDARGDRVPDFSHAGYRGGGVAIPDVTAVVGVSPVDGDDGAAIQAAIDRVSLRAADASGFRGAVVLEKGRYEIAGRLSIVTSGVVLRGSGDSEGGTVLVATGADRGPLIEIRGRDDRTRTAPVAVSDDYVPVGSLKLHIKSPHAFRVGDAVVVERPSPKAWLELLGMQVAPARTTYAWKPDTMNIGWDRMVTAVAGDEISLDAPLTTGLDAKLGGGFVAGYRWTGRIENVGVENLRCESTYDVANPKDEQHAWMAVGVEAARDVWIRRMTAVHFASSAVQLGAGVARATVQDCAALAPVSEMAGYRRHAFRTSGQQTLFLRCRAEDARGAFTVGYLAAGLNVFLECQVKNELGFSGSTGSWASGMLFDNVSIDGGELRFDNLESWQQGVGWAAANSVIWQASAGRFVVRTPPGAHNWAVGVWGLYTGDGAWARTSEFAEPDSLYRAQLSARLGKESLAALSEAAFAGRVPESMPASEQHPPTAQGKRSPLELNNGWLTSDGAVLVGRTNEVTWWRGRLEPSRTADVGPSLTRFAPGRSGTGLTDDLEELTAAMRASGQVAMRHHYGLWYDRRRDDHQMNRRPDAEVNPPFFEQPFLRSGQGEAWDRLSRYDLTRYNPWYFGRLKMFAGLARAEGLVLINEMYFQHNIIESGAHWVDCPWRPVNNINATGFTEPPPFTGDTIKMADEFYDVKHPVRAPLHRAYIRQCLANLADEPNVIHALSEEYTGPLHFMQYWLDVADEWMRETGRHPLLALSATKDVQDAILADPKRAKLISVIDLQYWFRTDRGDEFAPKGGESLAPRQHLRKWKGGRPSASSIADMVREYRAKFPDKAVISSLGDADGWAFAFAGGSLAKLPPRTAPGLLAAFVRMKPGVVLRAPKEAVVLSDGSECLVFLPDGGTVDFDFSKATGSLALSYVDLATGAVLPTGETRSGAGGRSSATATAGKPAVFWWKRP